MAERRNIDQIGIIRIDDHASDLAAILKADVRPGLACVGGFVHADAVGILAANVGFARANVNHTRIRSSDGDRFDRPDGDAFIGNRIPGAAGVLGLPDSASN